MDIGSRDVPLDTLPVRIDGIWYNLQSWRDRHPGGTQFIEYYRGCDATEVFYAFHNSGSRNLLHRLPRLTADEAAHWEQRLPPTSRATSNFRILRERLEKEGWWQRDYQYEARSLLLWAALFLTGLALAQVPGYGQGVALVLLTLGTVHGSWLAHDYVHGVDEFSSNMRLFAPLAIGIAPSWWNENHCKHHAVTNQMGADLDISHPPLYVWKPHPDDDSFLRHSQHIWFPIAYMSVFFSWRWRSIRSSIEGVQQARRGAVEELAALAVHWSLLLLAVPMPMIFALILLTGIICATILTTSHQAEDLYDEFQHDWVIAQFRSTRDAITRTAFTEWLWGGMQYQLEHHLFPTMPRNRYAKLREVLETFAEQNAIPGGYRTSDELDMVLRSWVVLKDVAVAPVGDASAPRLQDQILASTANSSP